ncbi:RNA polymerase sigma-70 factor (ECF subfamily) [Pedobacter cryoconitis]|uniref:RNA polymerase sigma-70 factor (ECF subfamily) n=1 Tax=Pedobacter cryoconitis TaxID=188932 RepID=A0A7W8ZR66_9SPHI|nr:sigma-70 family RNA polymerase sigma factor [Pedobacter cryoconitis]MBB5638716.1 RNA polymerase sigma-70 factor (ECF subfamily) [Pedobacter cryoconitis]
MPETFESDFFSLLDLDKNKAFEKLFDQFWQPLYRKAYSKVQSEDVAKDLVQEVFIAFWDNLGSLNEGFNIPAYLHGILRNKILKIFEKDAVRLKHALQICPVDSAFDFCSHELLLEKELKSIIEDEVNRMPSRMKEIYVLKKDDNFSVKQIADELGLSEQTIKNQLQNAYNRLRLKLKEYNPDLASFSIILIKFLFFFKSI